MSKEDEGNRQNPKTVSEKFFRRFKLEGGEGVEKTVKVPFVESYACVAKCMESIQRKIERRQRVVE